MAAFLEEYTLLDELGQGGFATVYKVRHNSLGYIRAVRILNAPIAYGESDKTYQKFLEKCRLLLRLGNGNHPNIVHIYQPLLKNNQAFVEMDFVDGKDLQAYLEEKKSFVEIGEVMKLLTDIGSALAYCHEDIYKFCMNKDEDELKDDPEDGSKVLLNPETRERLIKKYRVIHNDIHSGNIMRREDGNYVLLDFGLALDRDSIVRSSRRKNGVPEYKAPEKWDNDKLLTASSDIYSFGVVLYEFLTGRVPFLFDKKNSNTTEAEYLLGKAHKEAMPEPVFEFRKMAFERSHPGKTYEKDYPDWLEELIMKCLEKDPNDRFKNGKELFSYVQEHSPIGLDLWSLQKENEELRNLVEAANASNRKVDGFVMDLQEQLKESHNVQGGLNSQITVLQNENQTLKNELKVLSASCGASQEQSQKIQKLEKQLNSSNKKLEDISRELSSANKDKEVLKKENEKLCNTVKELRNTNKVIGTSKGDVDKLVTNLQEQLKDLFNTRNVLRTRITTLQNENQKLKSQNKSKGGKVWKFATFTLLLISLLCVGAMSLPIWEPLSTKISSLNSTSQSMIKLVKNRDNTIVQLKGQIQKKETQIDDLSSQVNTLTAEISSLKSANQGMVKQSAITELNNTITQLRTQIRNLNNTINKKNNEIKALQDQLFN